MSIRHGYRYERTGDDEVAGAAEDEMTDLEVKRSVQMGIKRLMSGDYSLERTMERMSRGARVLEEVGRAQKSIEKASGGGLDRLLARLEELEREARRL